MAVQYARIHGPVLASLLQSAVSGERMCDGLLLGTVRTVARELTHDDAEAHTVEEVVADITGCLSCVSTLSFYDGAGVVDGERLLQTAGDRAQDVIGWFVIRPVGALQPSLREAAVTASLRERLWAAHAGGGGGAAADAAKQPVLFAAVVPSQTHGGATASIDYRLLQPTAAPHLTGPSPAPGDRASSSLGSPAAGAKAAAATSAGPLVAVPLQTLNLGRSLGQHHQPEAMTSAQLVDGTALAAALRHVSPPAAEALRGQLGVAAAAAQEQAAALEAACQAMLQRLGDRTAALGGLHSEVAATSAVMKALLSQQSP